MGSKGSTAKVVLANSDGLDTSVIVPWLKEHYDCEMITFTAAGGQGEEGLAGLEEKAIQSGASRARVMNLREEFLVDHVFPTMQAGAVYEPQYLLGTSFARPFTAKYLVQVAHEEGADTAAYGCTGKGNDQVRCDRTVKALDPALKIIAPWREWNLCSCQDEVEHARMHGIPVPPTKESTYPRDRNLWHLSHEGGVLEDPWAEPEPEMFQLTVAPEQALDEPCYVAPGLEQGVPTQVDGRALAPVELLWKLNCLVAQHGVERAKALLGAQAAEKEGEDGLS